MNHRVHDYRYLVQRWRAVARSAGLRLKQFAETPAYPLYSLITPGLAGGTGVYISAGIHGDEPAGAEGLVTWAERHAHELNQWPLMLLPCLNPAGLVSNTRVNEDGVDLNRLFDRKTSPVVNALRQLLDSHRFALALTLHEDYDGQGAYIYEVQRLAPHWGESLLKLVSGILPIDPRIRIDGRGARAGLVRRRFEQKRFAAIGYPEAIYLHVHHAVRSLTFETPSEFALERRVAAQVAVIEECVRRVFFPQRRRHSTQTPR
jgi:hypothetical protein